MSPYGSLFERLAGEAAKRKGASHEECVIASVAAHLARMLSTRAGSAQTLPDYGLPDLNDMRLSLHDTLARSRLAIEGFIKAYEPRLCEVRVTSLPPEDESLKLLFSIEGCLTVGSIKRTVSFVASLEGGGKVNIA
ncbi:Type VI secretion system lysozyme-related protein [Pseudomonas cichorii]|uniref:Type VI secretion system lysozyme-related protein n=1 Tax=Pseudomonas cichorii TaxID=36746 RepID=A0A3M4LP82_PSECI|nr:type VI secretion system baseplate subunit TssE [Pseudomonas cichorii]RMQ43293.1 Type VI secretion system lysozyme-related protein [Pseudomonas cichorii]